MSDYCIVCAEPLEFTAYGPCGHNEACSKCVCRLRSILKDHRCVLCQQQQPAVVVTHFAGDFTRQINADEFETLQKRTENNEFFLLDGAQAYFDDQSHFKDMKSLCSYTHPLTGPTHFNSLKALKARLLQVHKRKFCDICLEGRKVFISEQITYDQHELDRHMKQGDITGAMAESGFSGHPACGFCKKRFYGKNELYEHNVRTHEECFLCKRTAPHEHVYYLNYASLEEHFRKSHYMCDQVSCREKGFVVFPTEQELKTHKVKEHSQNMSKAERKAALTLPMHVNYRRSNQGASTSSSSPPLHPLAAIAASGQGTVVIGGAASVPSHFLGQQHRRVPSRQNLQQIASINPHDTATSSNTNTNTNSTSTVPSSDAGGVRRSGHPAVPALLHEGEFPSMGAGSSMGPAVGGRWIGASSGDGSHGLNVSTEFPALPGTSKAAKKRANAKKRSSTLAQVLGGAGASSPSGIRILHSNTDSSNSSSNHKANIRNLEAQFPALSVHSKHTPNINTTSMKNRVEESTSSGGVVGPNTAIDPRNNKESKNIAISEALRAANRALIDKIKLKIGSDNSQHFDEFKQKSSSWVKGGISSVEYHAFIAGLGLASLVPELAATCPDMRKKDELLRVHITAFDDQNYTAMPIKKKDATTNKKNMNTNTHVESKNTRVPGSWVPPEAALAAAKHAAENSSWSCDVCTLVNAPVSRACEACGTVKSSTGTSTIHAGDGLHQWKKAAVGSGLSSSSVSIAHTIPRNTSSTAIASTAAPSVPQQSLQDAFPALPSLSASTSGGSHIKGEKNAVGNKKNGKQSLSSFYQHTKVHPQNPWKNPALKGEWASGGAGTLAQEERVLQKAWSKKK